MDPQITNWFEAQASKIKDKWTDIVESEIQFNPEDYIKFLKEETNAVESINVIKWEEIITNESKILELGCGNGWLAANILTIYNPSEYMMLDSDFSLLNNHVKSLFSFFKIDINRVKLINGYFSPIMLPDESINTIIACASLHHTNNLHLLAKECFRVLKPGGQLLILNENIIKKYNYIGTLLRKFASIMIRVLTNNTSEKFQYISSAGILYDPVLGDIDYLKNHWYNAFESAGFNLKEIDTHIKPYKRRKTAHTNKHLICCKSK